MEPSGALRSLPVGIAGNAVLSQSPGTPDAASRATEKERKIGGCPREEAARIVALHFDFIWRLLRRLGVSEGDVDDAAQHVFLVATQRGLRGSAADARPFLYGIALRIAANFRRTVRRRQEVPEDAMGERFAANPAADDVADLRRARALLDEILGRMPLDLRAVFVLSEIEQMTAVAIAELERIPTGTVASRLRRARELFRAQLALLGARNPFRGGVE